MNLNANSNTAATAFFRSVSKCKPTTHTLIQAMMKSDETKEKNSTQGVRRFNHQTVHQIHHVKHVPTWMLMMITKVCLDPPTKWTTSSLLEYLFVCLRHVLVLMHCTHTHMTDENHKWELIIFMCYSSSSIGRRRSRDDRVIHQLCKTTVMSNTRPHKRRMFQFVFYSIHRRSLITLKCLFFRF